MEIEEEDEIEVDDGSGKRCVDIEEEDEIQDDEDAV